MFSYGDYDRPLVDHSANSKLTASSALSSRNPSETLISANEDVPCAFCERAQWRRHSDTSEKVSRQRPFTTTNKLIRD
jgi:hypothetical protein